MTKPGFEIVESNVACPRCGYDLRGTVSAWSDQCPLEGTCTECGLRFDWSHVLMIAKYEPRWCVEFASDWIRVPRACAVTFVRSWFPWRFWRSMHMPSRVRWRRLGIYTSVMLLALALPYLVLQSTRAIMVRNYISDVLQTMAKQQLPQVAMLEERIAAAERGLYDQERHRVSRDEYIADLRIHIQNAMTRARFTPPSISLLYIEVILEALLHPLGDSSNGVITLPDGTTGPYPPPADYSWYLSDSLPNQNPWALPAGVNHRSLGAVRIDAVVALAMTLLLPASFVLLPASRRRAKVRWRHIGRIAIYSFALPCFAAALLFTAIGLRSIPQVTDQIPQLVWYLPYLIWLMLPAFWWAAIKRYLHMPHSLAVVFLMTVIILLLCAPIWLQYMPLWMESWLV